MHQNLEVMAIDGGTAYEEARLDLTELAGRLSELQLGATVPATPGWSVRDALAHVVGEASLLTSGKAQELDLTQPIRPEEQTELLDRYNAEEVERRRDVPLGDVLSEWEDLAARLVPMIRGEVPFPYPHPFLDAITVADLALHAQDVRNGLGMPGMRDSGAVRLGTAAHRTGLGFRLDILGLPALRIRQNGDERIVGSGDVAATVTAARYELFRALTGRRSVGQLRAYQWEGDPEPYLGWFSIFGPRDEDLTEP